MKWSSWRDTKSLTLLLVLAVSVGSCARSGSGTTRVRLPWADASGALVFQTLEIPTLTDPEHFSGDAARVFVEPGENAGSLSAAQPIGRYARRSDGLLIPLDFTTMEAVTAYAHQEKLRELDRAVGAESVLSWPLSIGVQVKLVSFGSLATNNAVYDAKLNSLLIVPYNQGALPISLNGGILAHEHFHFLFQKLVMSHIVGAETQTACEAGIVAAGWDRARAEKTARSLSPRIYNTYVLRGMNEGFADFWGWVYSGDDSFLARSMPSEDLRRRLDQDPGRLPNESLIRLNLVDSPDHPDQLISEIERAHNAYGVGTIYARHLRSIVETMTTSGRSIDEAKRIVARALINTLPALAVQVDAKFDSGFIDPNVVFESLMNQLGLRSSTLAEVCELTEKVRAFQDAYQKPSVCRSSEKESPRGSR